ncbi:LysE family transporter [Clostridium estertheticum]|uniref:LysE family transporter n=1 Tax=Clostridium estertheticum TaxID=238834 RepID=UPI001C0B08DF|nr:LysE family transporter [Clostridium estertheticum]MBU3174921.1 LysE family transporter [Clostridium estertheticum]MCB2358212.1 LysE family transporter [Clostridium estertheticum]
MNMQAMLAFLIYILINAFTPGPGNILALNTMTNNGWEKGKNLFFGIFTGYYFVQALCAFFTFGLDKLIHPVMFVLKYVGAVYIAWLAIHIALSKPDNKSEDNKPSFWSGFFLQFVNVKIFLFGITALTGYVVPYYTSLVMLLFFEMFIATIGIIATLTWIFFGGIFQKTYLKHFRVVNVILALILLQSAFGLVFR